MPYNENYLQDPAIAFEGMVADLGLALIVSKTVKTAALPYGFAVKLDVTDEHKVTPVTTGDTTIYGLSVRHQGPGISLANAANPDRIAVNDTAAIMLKGVMWVKVAVAVAPGDPVYVVVADGTYQKAAAAGRVQLAGAIYETVAAINGLARVRIL